MKITEIHVDRFGVWQDLALPTFDSGLNVIYGPNETGKSTLMRFIRGVLYGFAPAGSAWNGIGKQLSDSKGLLRIVHEGQEHDIHRFARHGEQGAVSIDGFDDDNRTKAAIVQLVSKTSEAMFERLFAVDLHELQELATLAGNELTETVYGLTLGPEGQTILDTRFDLERRRRELFDPSENSGRLAELFHRQAECSAEIEAAQTLRERHLVLSHERDELHAEIERRKVLQLQLQSQQQGHRFLEQAWPAWNRVRAIQRELEKLPTVSSFPEDGMDRLAQIDEEIDSFARRGQASIAAAKQLREQLHTSRTDGKFLQNASAVEAVCDRRERLEELMHDFAAAKQRAAQAAEMRDQTAGQLGIEWAAARLADVDTSPTAQLRLLDAARSYHGRLDRRGRGGQRYKQRAASCSRQAREIQKRQKLAGSGTIVEQIAAAKRRLSQREELNRRRVDEAELEHRRAALTERLARIDAHPVLPAWAYWVLGFFGVMGFIFAFVGFYTGLTVNGIVGLMYALLGTACGGTAYALKTHVESTAGENVEQLADALRDVEVRLRERREQVSRILDDALPAGKPVAGETTSSGIVNSPLDEPLVQHARRLSDLERLADAEQRITARRQRLSDYRSRLQQAQRDVISARQGWREVLSQLGLQETLRVDEAFQEWQRVLEANDAHRCWEAADRELNACRQSLDEIRNAIGRLAKQLGWENVDEADPLTVLDVWQEELEDERRRQSERQGVRREAKSSLREAAGYRRRIAKCRFLRASLLAQGGALNSEDFEKRAAGILRRKELQSALLTASAELEMVCRNEPDVAIVEEDMLAFDQRDNAARLKQIEKCLEQSESEQQSLFERLGSVKGELAELEIGRRGTGLRFDRARIDDELTRAAEEWFALELSGRALIAMQRQFERDHQPATLAAATKYLTQMTRGRYRNIWTPLGQQTLCLDDEGGRSFPVEQLSGGTREQLFLAIRLAIVEELSREGVELPMVLDDVFANFDQSRTEAAVETLLEFAAGGQQILFLTCHLHLARLLDAQGVNTIWLPNGCPTIEERRAG